MQTTFTRFALAMLLTVASVAASPAQEPQRSATMYRIDVVISRQEGDKKVSSSPYMLTAVATNPDQPGSFARGSTRMGLKLPWNATTTIAAADGKPATTTSKIEYNEVGTNIDVAIRQGDGGRFLLTVNVQDFAIPSGPTQLHAGSTLRTFGSSSTVLIRDGETAPLTTATDKVTGQVVKVEAKLTVVK